MTTPSNKPFTGHLVCEVDKNAHEVYRVMEREYKGHKLIDVRVWFDDPDSGELRPGKGVSIKADALPAIVKALASLVDQGGAQP